MQLIPALQNLTQDLDAKLPVDQRQIALLTIGIQAAVAGLLFGVRPAGAADHGLQRQCQNLMEILRPGQVPQEAGPSRNGIVDHQVASAVAILGRFHVLQNFQMIRIPLELLPEP